MEDAFSVPFILSCSHSRSKILCSTDAIIIQHFVRIPLCALLDPRIQPALSFWIATNLGDLESTITGCLREENQAFNGGAQTLLIYLMLIYFKLL